MADDVQPGVADAARGGDDESPPTSDAASADAPATDTAETDPAVSSDATSVDEATDTAEDAAPEDDDATDTDAAEDAATTDTDAAEDAAPEDADTAEDAAPEDVDTAESSATDAAGGDTDVAETDTDQGDTDQGDTDAADGDTDQVETVSAVFATETRTVSDADDDTPSKDAPASDTAETDTAVSSDATSVDEAAADGAGDADTAAAPTDTDEDAAPEDDDTDDTDADTDTAVSSDTDQGDTDAADGDTDQVETVSAVLATETRTVSDAGDDTPSSEEMAAELVRLRAEYEVLQHRLEVSEKAKPEPKPKRLHRPSRYWVSIACVVLGGLLLPLSVLVRWTSNTVLDTDSYVETVAPLAQNEDIQEAISFRVSVIILDAIDFRQQAEDALPPRAGFLAAPIESGVRILVQDVVDELVSTQTFERLWEDVNRLGHENVVAVLTGEGNDTLDTANGKVVVRLGPITEEVLNRLDEILGTDLKNAIPDERLDGEFVLVESDELANLQDEISLFDRLSWLIPILRIALLAASVIISRPRRLAFRRLGIAIVAPMTISLLLYDWIRSQYVGSLPDDIHNPDAAAAFFDITTRFVPRDMRVLLVLGIVILFLTWLFGPTGWAGRARAWWDTLVGRVGDKSEDRDVGAVPRWVADNERTLLAFAVALGVLTLLVWTRPTGLVVLTVIVVVVVVMAATSLVAAIGRRAETADEEGGSDAADASDADSATDAEPSVSN